MCPPLGPPFYLPPTSPSFLPPTHIDSGTFWAKKFLSDVAGKVLSFCESRRIILSPAKSLKNFLAQNVPLSMCVRGRNEGEVGGR